MTIRSVLIFVLGTTATLLVHADIPVHCVQPNVVGLWRFHVGTFQGAAGLDKQCGFVAPDPSDGHHKLTPPATKSKPEKGGYYLTDSFKETFTMEVLLRDWNSRVISVDAAGKQQFTQEPEKMTGGQWTMIYDEGFHVNVGGGDEGHHSFLAFSKYVLGKGESAGSTNNFANKQHSFCGNTLLGWHKITDPATGAIKSHQCWWGEKIKSLHEAMGTLPSWVTHPQGSNLTLPPAVPLPLDASSMQKPAKSPKQSRALSTDVGSGGTPLGLRGAGDGSSEEGMLRQPGAQPFPTMPMNSTQRHLFKRAMQALLILALGLTVFATWTSAGVGCSEKGQLNSWHGVARCSLFVSLVIIGVLWITAAGQPVPVVGMANEQSAFTPRTAPHRHSATVGEAADRLHANLQKARQNGVAVHWQSNPAKFKKWLQDRSQKHNMTIKETSTVQELLDSISPRRHVVGAGFHTDQVIGPVRAVAIKEQMDIAKNLGKSPHSLTTKDVRDGWTTSKTNHHVQRSFTMNGKALTPEGWETLTDFDWRSVSLQMPGGKTVTNFVNSVPDQGGCGSCYAVAATSMLTSRLMLKYPELHEKFAADRGGDRISVDQQLACNPYNQGCDGGYPYLISAWSYANEIVSHKCYEQTRNASRTGDRHSRRECPSSFQGEACKEHFRVSAWSYIGGALGRCGLHHLCENAMREELYKGGPLAVSVEPTAGFGYAEGVYHGVDGMKDDSLLSDIEPAKEDNKDCQGNECYIWRKVDHSVLLVGWGEDLEKGKTCQPRMHRTAETQVLADPGCEKIKKEQDCNAVDGCVFRGYPYWIIQNSYGPGFGREGYLYFGPRGQDPMRVEAMTLAADVEWVNRPAADEEATKPKEASALGEIQRHEDFGQ